VGWAKEEYDLWSKKLLADQIGFVVPSRDKGEAILRFAIVNPWTREIDIKEILDTLG
jgi:L-2,4-diaminobutyrate decarboxylase